jgi:hypothetical protein
MRIKEITRERITFDNGNYITYDHNRDCCERNYADFNYLQDEPCIMIYDFPEELEFELVNKYGFRFGNEYRKFLVPCYSEQNGYYSSDIDIYYNTENGENLFTANFQCLMTDD